MEDDDPFFASDDDFVWPELSSSGELPDRNVVGITICSVTPTPESNSNDEVANLGFSTDRKVEDNDNDDVKVRGENNEIRVNLKAKSSLIVEDDNEEMKIFREGESSEGFRVCLAEKMSEVEAKSSSKVEDDEIEIEIGKYHEKNEGFSAKSVENDANLPPKSTLMAEDEVKFVKEGISVNLAGKSSTVEANSSLKVDDEEIQVLEKDEFLKGLRANLAGKEDLKLKSKLGENSSLKVKDEEMKKQKKKEGFKVTKAPNLKSKSKMAEKSSLSAMECLIEMLKQMYEIELNEEDEVNILKTVKCRGMTFPRNRFLNNS